MEIYSIQVGSRLRPADASLTLHCSVVGHFSPLADDEGALADGDVVKMWVSSGMGVAGMTSAQLPRWKYHARLRLRQDGCSGMLARSVFTPHAPHAPNCHSSWVCAACLLLPAAQ